jgi:hypothetical protein
MRNIGTSSRRDFLLAAGLGGAGVAAAAVIGTGKAMKTATAAEAGEKSTTTAYRASPHIVKYYQTTEV